MFDRLPLSLVFGCVFLVAPLCVYAAVTFDPVLSAAEVSASQLDVGPTLSLRGTGMSIGSGTPPKKVHTQEKPSAAFSFLMHLLFFLPQLQKGLAAVLVLLLSMVIFMRKRDTTGTS